MKNTYLDLIEQTFDFPQNGFNVVENQLYYYDIPLMDIVKHYDTPLKITYLPKISENIQQAIRWFNVAMAKVDYKGSYTYCYCTKSNHFSFVLEEILKNDAHIETSSAYDFYILENLQERGLLDNSKMIVCNGFKRELYLEKIKEQIEKGYNVIPVLDNKNEVQFYKTQLSKNVNIGIRIASEEEPSFEFYTSRLGIRYKDIKDFYVNEIKPVKHITLKMLHFFINTGIKDSAYYWSELYKVMNVYAELKAVCPTLDTLNIGGGLPFRNSLGFDFDYEYMIEEIISQIKEFCEARQIPEPNIVTEFGSYTVAESGINIYKIIGEKQQNDTERWYMIDNSFITTLPDTWGINQRFILLALNHWDNRFNRVNIGGLTCDSLDYYNAEAHVNQVFLPMREPSDDEPLYIGFFNTGAYQESLSGYGGIKHCLIPSPKHIVIDIDEEGNYRTKLFAKEQSYKSMMKTLGY